jgi:hypothetical protein
MNVETPMKVSLDCLPMAVNKRIYKCELLVKVHSVTNL